MDNSYFGENRHGIKITSSGRRDHFDAEIYQKQRTVAERLKKQEKNICEKTQKLFTDAQEQLNKAHEAWEEATKEHMKAVRQKLESTREQLTELQQKVEKTVEELREAMNIWHSAHRGLILKLG